MGRHCEPFSHIVVLRYHFVLSYLICIPLGLWKAVHHGSKLDSLSSGLIFSGYVMPGYALGILLIIFLAGGSYLDIFPLGGLTSDDFEDFSFFGKIVDLTLTPVLLFITKPFGKETK